MLKRAKLKIGKRVRNINHLSSDNTRLGVITGIRYYCGDRKRCIDGKGSHPTHYGYLKCKKHYAIECNEWVGYEIKYDDGTIQWNLALEMDIQEVKGFDINDRTLLRNCTEPELGLHILNESKRNIQPELFGGVKC
jgi:hypothetical protein